MKIGDVVRLKSGGPRMAITGINNYNGTYFTTWFDSGYNIQSGYFNPAILVSVSLDVPWPEATYLNKKVPQ